MKICSADIAAFGKFKNYHIDFDDNMTVIYGENESGKTTLTAFLRMVFYGCSSRSVDIDKNLRKKYRPWDSELMAGSVTFKSGERSYRLEREFRQSDSTDVIRLVDLEVGTVESLSGGERPGERFFGLSEEAFRRIVLLEDGGSEGNHSADGELNARLSNLSSTGEEQISFEGVKARLEKAKERIFSKRGVKGPGPETEAELKKLCDMLEEARSAEKEVERLERELAEKEELLRAEGEETAKRFEMMKAANKLKKLKLLKRYIEAEKEIGRLKEGLTLRDGGLADEAFFREGDRLLEVCDRADELIKTAEESRERLLNRDRELSAALPSRKTLEKTENSKSDAELEALDRRADELRTASMQLQTELEGQRPQKKLRVPLLIFGLTALAAGVALFFLFTYAGVGLAAAGALLVLCSILFKRKVLPESGELRAQIDQNSRELSIILDQKQTLLLTIEAERESLQQKKLKAAADEAKLAETRRELSSSEELLTERIASLNTAEQALRAHFGRLGEAGARSNVKALAEKGKKALAALTVLEAQLPALHRDANCDGIADAEEKIAHFMADPTVAAAEGTEISGDELQTRMKSSAALKGEVAALSEKISALSASTPSVALLEKRQAELEERLKEYKSFLLSADLASEVLEEAFREIRKTFSGSLDTRTAEIFALLTDGKYETVTVSKSFEMLINPEEGFGVRESDFLSHGTEDQLYLALRLALASLIDEGDSLPIVMDDPLASFDDRRAENALAFLRDWSADRQTLLFTCHSNICDMARELNLKISEI